MQTAPGQAAKGSSNRNAGNAGRGTTTSTRLNPVVVGIAVLLLIISLVIMGAWLFKFWPPPPPETNKSVAEQWRESRTATPGIQHADGLKVEKVGTPRRDGDTVTVTLKVTNNVMMPGPDKGTPTPGPGEPAAAPLQATVYNGSIRVLFFNDVNDTQQIVGGGYGNVTNLKYGESKTIEVVSTGVENYSDATQYEAFPDYVWTDKDPEIATPGAGPTTVATPFRAATP